MILAAAVRIKLKDADEYLVLCGARHGDVFNQMAFLGIDKSKRDLEEEVQGFINHKNEFLTRKEAFEHAKACGQLCEKIIYDRENGGVGGTNLISEDLW